ncbi:MAG: GNAT family N-acetyltransferase [Planctomycetota bacterium]
MAAGQLRLSLSYNIGMEVARQLDGETRDASPAVERGSPMTLLPARMLLGPSQDPGASAAFWVARDRAGLIAGAARLSAAWHRPPHAGPMVALHVAASARRQGIGRALVTAVIGEAKKLGARAIHSDVLLPAEDGTTGFAARLGFEPGPETHRSVLDAGAVQHECSALLRRLRDRAAAKGSDLPLLRAIDIGQAELAVHRQIAKTQAAELGGDPAAILARIQGRDSDAFDPEVSVAVLDSGDQLVGFGLGVTTPDATTEADRGLLESIYIAPPHRRSHAAIVLKLSIAERYVARGFTLFSLLTDASHADTRRQIERLGPLEEQTLCRPVLRLSDGAEG